MLNRTPLSNATRRIGTQRIDWNNPLSKGLAFLTVTDGAVPHDLVGLSGHPTTITGTTVSFQADAGGFGTFINGGTKNSNYVDWASTAGMPTTGSDPWTIEALLAMTASSNLSTMFGFGASLPFISIPNERRYLMAFGGSPLQIFLWAGVGYQTSVQWRTDGSLQHIFWTFDGISTTSLYRDGVRLDGTASLTGVNTVSSTNHVYIGNGHSSASNNSTYTLFKGAVYNRVLSAGEIMALTQSPYSQLRYSRARVGAGVTGGGPLVRGELIRGGSLTRGRLIAA